MQTFINTVEDVTWLRETHLRPEYAPQPIPIFGAAIIYGNEDCPERIELYYATDPLYTDKPEAVYVYDNETGRYQHA